MTRKTKTVLITVCLLLTVTAVSVLAASGGTSDPLASLSYLTGTFSDVPLGRWYSDAIDWAAEAGVITGAGGRFRPCAIQVNSLALY